MRIMLSDSDFVVQALTRPLDKADFDRFNIYRRRMKKLEFYGIDSSFISNLVHSFQACYPRTKMFPNVRKVRLGYGSGESPLDVLPMLSASLHDVTLDFATNKVAGLETMTFISILRRVFPSIKNLHIKGSLELQETNLPPVVFNISQLRRLHLSGFPVDWATISHLASLPNLLDLHLAVPRRGSAALPTSVVPPPLPFQSLRRIALNVHPLAENVLDTDFASAIYLIAKFLLATSLTDITVCPIIPITSSELRKFFADAFTLTSTHQLSRISVKHDADRYEYNPPAPQLFSSDFDLLLHLQHLTYFEIDIHISLALIDNNLLKAMSTSWPHLEELHLGGKYSGRNQSRCTLEGLTHLARRCPSLRHLTIVMEASTESDQPHRTNDYPVGTRLEILDVGMSAIIRPRAVASFLSEVFPNIQRLQYRGEEGLDEDVIDAVENMGQWREAVELYQNFVGTRKNERALADV